jgi:hypothetical protein
MGLQYAKKKKRRDSCVEITGADLGQEVGDYAIVDRVEVLHVE